MRNPVGLSPGFACSSGSRQGALGKLARAVLFFSIASFVAPTIGLAGTAIWDGGTGNWFGPNGTTTWFCFVGGFPAPCGPPNGAGWSANIGTGGGSPITGTVNLNGPVNLPNGLSLGNGATGTLQVSSGANTLTAGTLNVGFSGPGSGNLAISGGGVVTDSFAYLGATAGSVGNATVSGASSQWNVSTQFLVGDNGQGTLSIQNGAVVTSTGGTVGYLNGSSGQVTVSGTGAQWNNSGTLRIGSSGNGTLTVTSGGAVSSDGGANGQVGLIVGEVGQGTLVIENGATLNAANGSLIGDQAGSSGAMTVSGAGSQLNTPFVAVGWSGNGSLTLSDGGVVNATGSAIVSAVAGSTSSVLVTGLGSQLNTPGLNVLGSLAVQNGGAVTGLNDIRLGGSVTVSGTGSQLTGRAVGIGEFGTGTLNVSGGGMLATTRGAVLGDLSGSAGNVTISGLGSQWVDSGSGYFAVREGLLTVQNGGQATTSNTLYVGDYSGSSGTVAVNGSGSHLAAGAAVIGQYGSGAMNISNGGVVNDAGVWLAANAGGAGSVTVTGAGSQWIDSGSLTIGYAGQGTLTIADGGVVNAAGGWIGSSLGGSGVVTVTGAGSQWIDSGGLYAGQGTLTIADGGQVTDFSATVGTVSGSTADVLVDAATWTTSGQLFIGTNGTGVVTVMDNGHLSAGNTLVGSHGSLIIDPAVVNIFGNFTLAPGGLLSFDIAGLTPDLFSQLDISGFGLFQGTIAFDFINGFAPATGDTFDLIKFLGGADFTASSFVIEGLDPGFHYTETFSNGSFSLVALNDGVSTSATPEPSAGILFATGLIVLLSAGAWSKARFRRNS